MTTTTTDETLYHGLTMAQLDAFGAELDAIRQRIVADLEQTHGQGLFGFARRQACPTIRHRMRSRRSCSACSTSR